LATENKRHFGIAQARSSGDQGVENRLQLEHRAATLLGVPLFADVGNAFRSADFAGLRSVGLKLLLRREIRGRTLKPALEALWRVSIALRKRFGTGPVIRPLKEEATVRPERSP
jgi:hypothetical protein